MRFWKTVFNQIDSILAKTHPEYDANIENWEKYRLTFAGGTPFIDEYLNRFSPRENSTDFAFRKAITYCPAHAKSAILEIKNAIYQRMIDITRKSPSDTYMQAISGENNGVDRAMNSMDSFIGSNVLPDLLSIGKVGVFVDREITDTSKLANIGNNPYLYTYGVEQIRSWRYDHNRLVALLLENVLEDIDENTGLVTGYTSEYLKFNLSTNGVITEIYDDTGKKVDSTILKLPVIPFVIFELSQSLLVDIANYQIALLNLASSDMNYAVKANFPFYTEQYDAIADMSNMRNATSTTTTGAGEAATVAQAKNSEVRVGITQGRRYPRGVERPGFINPSSEPLNASMEKQEQLKKEIRQLVHLSLQNVTARSISAESKKEDQQGLESGLANIGLELEFGERQIATIWNAYEGKTDDVVIKYPNNYSLRTDDDRRREAKEFREGLSSTPSKTYQKEISKIIATITIGHKVTVETLKKIHTEIDAAELIVASPEDIVKDHEAGFVSTQTASTIRGYDKTEAAKAKIDHAERAARIVTAQINASAIKNAASRGVKDLDNDTESGKTEKKDSVDDTLDVKQGKKQRGDGK